VFDIVAFSKEINDLMRRGQQKSAEDRLLQEYVELKALGNMKELEFIASQLAHFYSMPQTENLGKAEAYFLEREALAPGAYAELQTAMFYFYVARDFGKTIKKVDHIKDIGEITDLASYYSALALKGQALIMLEKIADAKRTLDEILDIINMNSISLPHGDEINLLEMAASNSILVPICREILNHIVFKMRSQEYRERANTLLKSI
jgi:hypothetical protein